MVWYRAFWVCCCCHSKAVLFNCWIKNCTLGALQMKMTATCGIQRFRWMEKNKTLAKILGVATPCNLCGVDAYGATQAALFSVSICVSCFFVWAASYDGLMPPLAACHCNCWYVLFMLCTWQMFVSWTTQTVLIGFFWWNLENIGRLWKTVQLMHVLDQLQTLIHLRYTQVDSSRRKLADRIRKMNQ